VRSSAAGWSSDVLRTPTRRPTAFRCVINRPPVANEARGKAGSNSIGCQVNRLLRSRLTTRAPRSDLEGRSKEMLGSSSPRPARRRRGVQPGNEARGVPKGFVIVVIRPRLERARTLLAPRRRWPKGPGSASSLHSRRRRVSFDPRRDRGRDRDRQSRPPEDATGGRYRGPQMAGFPPGGLESPPRAARLSGALRILGLVRPRPVSGGVMGDIRADRKGSRRPSSPRSPRSRAGGSLRSPSIPAPSPFQRELEHERSRPLTRQRLDPERPGVSTRLKPRRDPPGPARTPCAPHQGCRHGRRARKDPLELRPRGFRGPRSTIRDDQGRSRTGTGADRGPDDRPSWPASRSRAR